MTSYQKKMSDGGINYVTVTILLTNTGYYFSYHVITLFGYFSFNTNF